MRHLVRSSQFPRAAQSLKWDMYSDQSPFPSYFSGFTTILAIGLQSPLLGSRSAVCEAVGVEVTPSSWGGRFVRVLSWVELRWLSPWSSLSSISWCSGLSDTWSLAGVLNTISLSPSAILSDLWCMGYLNLCYLTRNACLKSMVVLQQIGAGIKFIFLRLVQISCLEWEPNYHNCTGCSHLYIYTFFYYFHVYYLFIYFFTSILPLSSIFTHFQSS